MALAERMTEKAIARSQDLAEGGRGVRFVSGGAPSFALRFGGRVVAYRNACPHTGGELDWNEGDFLDGERRLIVWAPHGGVFDPATGRCVAGPCRGARLEPVVVRDDGESVVVTE